MNIIKTVMAFAVASVMLIAACKKNDSNSNTTTTTSTSATTSTTSTTSTTGTNPTVIPTQTIVQPPVTLHSLSTIAILAGAAISNTGATVVTGDLALSPGSSVSGFPPGILNGDQHISDSIASQGKIDLTTAYNDATNRITSEIVTLSGNIGGLTLTPGLYKSTSSLAISSGDLTFDAKGNPNAVFVIQMQSTFTTTSGRQIILSGGAQAANIFWQVGSSATFGTTSVLKGNFFVMESITFQTGATLNGRAMARTGSVSLAGNTITKP